MFHIYLHSFFHYKIEREEYKWKDYLIKTDIKNANSDKWSRFIYLTWIHIGEYSGISKVASCPLGLELLIVAVVGIRGMVL